MVQTSPADVPSAVGKQTRAGSRIAPADAGMRKALFGDTASSFPIYRGRRIVIPPREVKRSR
jgi:hypothetical protein